MKKKLLTWDVSYRRGWIGPSWCHKCRSNEESENHLFTMCSYARHVWEFIAPLFKISVGFVAGCLEEWFEGCMGSKVLNKYRSLPYIFVYFVWWVGNLCIFKRRLSWGLFKNMIVVIRFILKCQRSKLLDY
jgi:hypothetical protein